MSSSRALRWFVLLLLLPLTLSWKLAIRPSDPGELQQQEKDLQRKIVTFLIGQRFDVSVSENMQEGQPSIRATAGSCRILVAKSPSVGWDRDLIRQHATPEDRVFVVFRGKVYADQPTWLTVSDFLWARVRRELGLRGRSAPVWAIIALPSCEAERLPWIETA